MLKRILIIFIDFQSFPHFFAHLFSPYFNLFYFDLMATIFHVLRPYCAERIASHFWHFHNECLRFSNIRDFPTLNYMDGTHSSSPFLQLLNSNPERMNEGIVLAKGALRPQKLIAILPKFPRWNANAKNKE